MKLIDLINKIYKEEVEVNKLKKEGK